jgi:F0F1-type ATP synthase membrane subunit c/vacuolar-type H+-ATPase subunit K
MLEKADMLNRQNVTEDIDSKHRTMLTLWFGFISSIVMYLVISMVLPRPEGPQNKMLNIVLGAVSAFLIGISFAVKKSFFSRAEEKQDPRLVTTGFLLAAALCEAGALVGLLDLFAGRNKYYFVLIIFSFLGLLFHFPKRSHLQSAIYRLPDSRL